MKKFSIELWPYKKYIRKVTPRGKVIVPVEAENVNEAYNIADGKCFGSTYWPMKKTAKEISDEEFTKLKHALEQL